MQNNQFYDQLDRDFVVDFLKSENLSHTNIALKYSDEQRKIQNFERDVSSDAWDSHTNLSPMQPAYPHVFETEDDLSYEERRDLVVEFPKLNHLEVLVEKFGDSFIRQLFCLDGGEERLKVRMTTITRDGEMTWYHTEPTNLKKSMKYYSNLFYRLDNFDFSVQTLDQFLEIFIEFSWLGAHLPIYTLGNAQALLNIQKYLALKHHLELGPVRVEVTYADCVALSVPLQRYRELYPTLVEFLPRRR